jgi:hypothetical protein
MQNPPMLLNRNVFENSNMDGAINVASTENKYVLLLYGSFADGIAIVDRIGSTLELVPHLFGANRRPTGQRGALLWFRTGSDVMIPTRFDCCRSRRPPRSETNMGIGEQAGRRGLRYGANRSTGGGNFNPNMKIDLSHVSVSPPAPPPPLGGGLGASLPGGVTEVHASRSLLQSEKEKGERPQRYAQRVKHGSSQSIASPRLAWPLCRSSLQLRAVGIVDELRTDYSEPLRPVRSHQARPAVPTHHPSRSWRGCAMCKRHKRRGAGRAVKDPTAVLRKLGKRRRVSRRDLGA